MDQYSDHFIRLVRQLEKAALSSESPWPIVRTVKAALVLTDSAGSAATRTGLHVGQWLSRAFDEVPLTSAEIEESVISPRIKELQQLGKWHGFHDFQLACADLSSRALLLSGCGTGKTLAAWKWVAAQLRAGEYRRAIFLYPTRATATEGFRDYASWAGPEAAALIHGTASFEIETMFGNPADDRSGFDFTTDDRLFALERFLDAFDVPVLCMTASLPPDRLDILRDRRGLQVFPEEADRFHDLQRQATAPRYQVRLTEIVDVPDLVGAAVGSGKKVLYVVNTVDRCQQAAAALQEQFPGQVECFHSRFRLVDRRERHRHVIDRFQAPSPEGLVLVATQVCEMSLDLDADVLVTEAAPVPSLIQRMGRCCREPIPRLGRIGEVAVYRPAKELPYEAAEVDQGVEFAAHLANCGSVSQADLTEYISKLDVRDPLFAGGFAGLLDSKWYANGGDDSFRERDDYSTDAVLDSDVDCYVSARARRDPAAAGWVVPAPRNLTRPDGRLGQFLRVVPASLYDPILGLRGRLS